MPKPPHPSPPSPPPHKDGEEASSKQESQQEAGGAKSSAKGDEQAKDQQAEQQQPDQQQRSEKKEETKSAEHLAVDLMSVDLPTSDEDLERIMAFPHVTECNLCRVCVPHDVVARHPRAQEAAAKLRHIFDVSDVLDPNVELKGEEGEDRRAAGLRAQSRRRLRSSSSSSSRAVAGRRLGRSRSLQQHVAAQQNQGALQPEDMGHPALHLPRSGPLPEAAMFASSSWDAYGQLQSTSGGGGPSAPAPVRLSSDAYTEYYSDDEFLDEEVEGDGAAEAEVQPWNDDFVPGQEEPVFDMGGVRHRQLLTESNRDEIESDSVYHRQGRSVDLSQIAPGDTKAPKRKHLPNCTVCWGCKHTLELMASGQIMFDSYYAHEPGGSPSWLFRVRSNKTDSGWAVVKTWCVPVMKVKQRGFAMCSKRKVFAQIKLLLAQQQITAECGLNDIVPKLWIEPVLGVIPGHGWRIDWLGLFFDTADGVSVQNLQEFGRPPIKPELVIDLFTNRVNHTELRLAAIFDVLFSQCDRHQQNIFLTESGQLRLIDNDQVYATAWRKCGFDSMILPTTQKFMINHLGFFYVLKYPHQDPPKTWSTNLNPLALLDYRCHSGNNGTIGKDFPRQLRTCMRRLGNMTAEQVHWEYGYPNLRMADAVRNRSRDMLSKGFEWTLLYGEPTNQPMHRYKIAPSCCHMKWNPKDRRYQCLDKGYHQITQLPYGNPWHGGKWHGPAGKDTGTYVGGTEF